MLGMDKSWRQATSPMCLDPFGIYMRNWMNGLINGQELKTPTCCWLYHTYHGMVQNIGPAPKIRMICQGAFDRRLFAIFWKIQDFVQICTLKSRTTKSFTKKQESVRYYRWRPWVLQKHQYGAYNYTACHQSNRKSTTTWGMWIPHP